MQLPDVSAASKRSISTVTIGALKEDGGTRGKTVTVGGQTALPHLTFDGCCSWLAGFREDGNR